MSSAFLDKINVVAIVSEHANTLVDASTGHKRPGDFVLFYVVPAVIAGEFVYADVHFSDGALAVLATGFSILAGLLFNLLLLLHTLELPETHIGTLDGAVKKLKRELHANIAYAIVISLGSLVPLVIASNYPPDHFGRRVFGYVSTYLAVHFVLTMGMVLKRMHTMLEHRLN